jgi:hypothetical protein
MKNAVASGRRKGHTGYIPRTGNKIRLRAYERENGICYLLTWLYWCCPAVRNLSSSTRVLHLHHIQVSGVRVKGRILNGE